MMVGLATGIGALTFIKLIEFCRHLFFGFPEPMLTALTGDFAYWVAFIPMLGGLLVGPVVHHYASEAKGHGVPEVMLAVARRGGIIRPRVAIAKIIASAICIGSGGSAGREGPIVQIGSAIGSSIGQFFKMSGQRIKVLVGCGAAAGISAVFNAPIAGVIFSMEVILGDFAIKTFSPVLISSVVASVFIRHFLGNHPAFDVPNYTIVSFWEFPLYVILGVICGLIAVLFTVTLSKTEVIFENLRISPHLKPALGGLLLGGIGIFYPQVFSDGYNIIKLTLYGKMMFGLMFLLIFLKILATNLTLGSGNSGGIFAPSLFIGAVTGGAFGYTVSQLFPSITAGIGPYSLVGMAALVGGATHAPITAILIVFEMTSDYRIILPLMVSVVFSTLVAQHLFRHSIYTVKLARRGIELKGGRDTSVLKNLKVSEVLEQNYFTVDAATAYRDIIKLIQNTKSTFFIVTGNGGRYIGVLSYQEILGLLSERLIERLIVARDLTDTNYPVTYLDDSLDDANRKMAIRDYSIIPVLDRAERPGVVGVLRRERIFQVYDTQLVESSKE
ncbi:MAG: chloride channel protein [bacterium]